jgi:tRNA(Arg) A34 adenosine deaminase TadA
MALSVLYMSGMMTLRVLPETTMGRRHIITALIYDRKGKLLSIGQNSYTKTHPLQKKCAEAVGEPTKIYLHAEIAALVRLSDWSAAHKIVVTRFNKLGKPVTAYPCKCCQHALTLAGIKEIEST